MSKNENDFLGNYFSDDDDLYDYEDIETPDEEIITPVEDYRDEDKETVVNKKLSRRSVRGSKRTSGSRSKLKIVSIIMVFILLLSSVGFFMLFAIKNEIFTQGSIGVQAVKTMYEFSNLDELENNLPKLASLTTQEVYNDIAVTDNDKALNVYLKFKKNAVKVEVIDSKPGYVLYTLDSSSLSSGRLFSFSYTLNWYGKIDTVREMECIDFYKQ